MTHENCDIIGFCDDTGGLILGDNIQTIEIIAIKCWKKSTNGR